MRDHTKVRAFVPADEVAPLIYRTPWEFSRILVVLLRSMRKTYRPLAYSLNNLSTYPAVKVLARLDLDEKFWFSLRHYLASTWRLFGRLACQKNSHLCMGIE